MKPVTQCCHDLGHGHHDAKITKKAAGLLEDKILFLLGYWA